MTSPEIDPTLPPLARPGELSARAKSVESSTSPGAYITKMGVRPIRLGKGEKNTAAFLDACREKLGYTVVDIEFSGSDG